MAEMQQCGMCGNDYMAEPDDGIGLCQVCAEADRDYKDDLMEGMRMPWDLG
jgi:hypothetical protein